MIIVKLQSEKHAREKFSIGIGDKNVTIKFDENGSAETEEIAGKELIRLIPEIKIIGAQNMPEQKSDDVNKKKELQEKTEDKKENNNEPEKKDGKGKEKTKGK